MVRRGKWKILVYTNFAEMFHDFEKLFPLVTQDDKRKIQELLIKKKLEKYVHTSGTFGPKPANENIENSKMKN